jgi:hypothetical protein
MGYHSDSIKQCPEKNLDAENEKAFETSIVFVAKPPHSNNIRNNAAN